MSENRLGTAGTGDTPLTQVVRKTFSSIMFEFYEAKSDFLDMLHEAGFDAFERIGGDDYDGSIEFWKANDALRMNEAAQRIVFDAGFCRAYVNHLDGWETHYSWRLGEQFQLHRGWRRFRRAGGFDINYWPESWTQTQWLETGYIRIVPDPLPLREQE